MPNKPWLLCLLTSASESLTCGEGRGDEMGPGTACQAGPVPCLGGKHQVRLGLKPASAIHWRGDLRKITCV